jgi:hypothetical protein
MTTHDDTSNNERKRSSSSTTTAATKKGKDRKKSEGSIYFMSDEGQMGKVIKKNKSVPLLLLYVHLIQFNSIRFSGSGM